MMKRMKEMREELHLTQDGLALKLNMSQSTVSFYETGERTPDIEAAVKIAKFFDVSLDYLLGRSDVKKPVAPGGLNAAESNLLNNYRKLNAHKRAQADAFVSGLAVE